MGVHEVMPVNEEISRLIVAGATSEHIRKAAVEQGMLTLRQDGLAKVAAGITTLAEVEREVGL